MTDILSCPFCGSKPEFPEAKEVFGTCYDAGCEDCGIATISIQIIDCFGRDTSPSRDDVNDSWDDMKVKYGNFFIDIVRREAIDRWNKRS